jgi:predicted small secreted protein
MMKKIFAGAVAVVAMILAGCAGVPSVPTDLMGAAKTVQSAAQTAGAVDFKTNEVLCADGDERDALSMHYRVATVLTPASPATKNQAEVLFVANGKKAWTTFVVPSHKAAKAELTVGKLVYHISGWSDADAKNVSAEEYRQSYWQLERITSVDELFKNRIEVGGAKYDPGLIRIPDAKLD